MKTCSPFFEGLGHVFPGLSGFAARLKGSESNLQHARVHLANIYHGADGVECQRLKTLPAADNNIAAASPDNEMKCVLADRLMVGRPLFSAPVPWNI